MQFHLRHGCLRLAALLVLASALLRPADVKPEPATRLRAVVELFSSQGCSACPPAHRMLAELALDPDLMALTLPVDYWNYLGWKDTLARPAFTARQRSYATARGDRHLYTPQVVVNGTVAGVGTQRDLVDRAVGDAGALRVAVGVREAPDALSVEIGAGFGTADVWLLPVRRRQEVTVTRGENQGRTLAYVNVVRDMRPIGTWSGSAMTIAVPLDAIRSGDADGYVVLLQQATPSGQPGPILGAAKGPSL